MVASFSFPASKISAIKRPPYLLWSRQSSGQTSQTRLSHLPNGLEFSLFVPPALHSGALTDRDLERLPRNGKINTPLLYQKEGDKHGHSLHQLDVPLVGQNLRLFPAF